MMTMFVALDWPSDYGWKGIIMWSLMLARRMSSFQKIKVNTGSRSETMDYGILCRCTMSVKKAYATESAE